MRQSIAQSIENLVCCARAGNVWDWDLFEKNLVEFVEQELRAYDQEIGFLDFIIISEGSHYNPNMESSKIPQLNAILKNRAEARNRRGLDGK